MAKIRGVDGPAPIGRREGWYMDPGNSHRERYWDGSAWTDQFRLPNPHAPTKTAYATSEVPRGTEACLDCGGTVGLTARACPHCGGTRVDGRELSLAEATLADINRSVTTIKNIMVAVVVLWLLGLILLVALSLG